MSTAKPRSCAATELPLETLLRVLESHAERAHWPQDAEALREVDRRLREHDRALAKRAEAAWRLGWMSRSTMGYERACDTDEEFLAERMHRDLATLSAKDETR